MTTITVDAEVDLDDVLSSASEQQLKAALRKRRILIEGGDELVEALSEVRALLLARRYLDALAVSERWLVDPAKLEAKYAAAVDASTLTPLSAG